MQTVPNQDAHKVEGPAVHRTFLPERDGRTFKFHIQTVQDGKSVMCKGYLTASFFPDGDVGEIFVRLDKQGSQVSGFVDAWAIAVSKLLQRGVSLEEIVRTFRGCRFAPDGLTGNPEIPFVTSPVDYIVRLLELKFLKPKEDKP